MFRDPNIAACLLCGSTDNLTGEHKIKASALRQEFGGAHLAVGTKGVDAPLRYAQSAKSKNLHFKARLCRNCNSTRTQAADRAFEKFHQTVRHLYENEEDLNGVCSQPEMMPGTNQYLNTFRYFAKLLACHLAEMGAPIQSEISNFAIAESDYNPIGLFIRHDSTFARTAEEFPDLQYAAHGGVVVFGSKYTFWPTTFYSSRLARFSTVSRRD